MSIPYRLALVALTLTLAACAPTSAATGVRNEAPPPCGPVISGLACDIEAPPKGARPPGRGRAR